MRWIRKGLRLLVMAVLLLLCAALFYVLVIMGDTPRVDTAAAFAMARSVEPGALPLG